jgi:preprotein translocase subunit SecY
LVILKGEAASVITRESGEVVFAQSTAGLSALAWLIVALLAVIIIFGLIFYVKRMRRDTPTKKPDRGGFDR